jgi:hypothetical protein
MTQNSRKESDELPAKRFGLLTYEAILIAVVTACGYLFAFYYEKGYLSHFGVPLDLISVDLLSVLKFSTLFFAVVFTLFPIINAFPILWPTLHPYLAFYLPRFLFLFLFAVVIPFLMFGFERIAYWLIGLIGVGTASLLFLVGPLFVYRKEGSWKARLDAADAEERISTPTVATQIHRIGGPYALLLFGSFAFATFLVTIAGESAAMREKTHLVIHGEPELLVLKVYGENAICAEFNRATKTVGRKFRVIKVTQNPDVILHAETIGPVSVQEP